MVDWEIQLAQWDCAPLAMESQVRKQARSLDQHLQTLPVPPDQEARWWRLRSRLQCLYPEGEMVEAARQSVHWAARSGQWDELEQTLTHLRGLEDLREAPQLPPEESLRPLLLATEKLVSCDTLRDLRQATLELVLEHTSLNEIAWLERESGRWQLQVALPAASRPRFSEQVLHRCESERITLFGETSQLGDSRSLMLSEVHWMVAVPLHWQEQSFGILYCELDETGLQEGSLRILEFLSSLVAATAQRLASEEKTARAYAEAQAMYELRHRLTAATALGLAVADREGRLEEWNPSFAEFWDEGPHNGQFLWEMFQGAEQHNDRQLLTTPGTRLVVQRTAQGRRWLQVSDWVLDSQARKVRSILDLTSQEPRLWSQLLEEMRQELAADAHDGPVQTAAALKFQGHDQVFNGALRRLQCLRSPWLEDRDAREALEQWLQRWGKDIRIDLQWQGPLEVAWEQQCYRCLLTLCEELAVLGPLQCLRLRVSPECCRITWIREGGGYLPEIVHEWLQARLDLSVHHLRSWVERVRYGQIWIESAL